jgi:hypothetical protein
VPQASGRPAGALRRDHARKDDLLVADTDPIAVFEDRLGLDLLAVHFEPVATAEVENEDAIATDDDLRVFARNERIVDRDVTLRAATENGLTGREVELLQ